MEKLVQVLREKSDKHLGKLAVHNQVKRDLEMELEALKGKGPRIPRLNEQLLSTHKGIEYHAGSSKTYLKVVEMIESGQYN